MVKIDELITVGIESSGKVSEIVSSIYNLTFLQKGEKNPEYKHNFY